MMMMMHGLANVKFK